MNMKNNLMLACGTTLLIMGCSSAYDKSDESHNIQVPAVKFDLSQWNITVPLDVNNDKKVDTISVKDIQKYQHPDYFFLDSDGNMVFAAPNKAFTTPNSSNTRSELRQVISGANSTKSIYDKSFALTSHTSADKFKQLGGNLQATLKVNHVAKRATYTEKAPAYSVVVGQIHAEKDKELVKAGNGYGYGNEPLKIYFKKRPNHKYGSVFWNYERNLPKENPDRKDISYPVWGNSWLDDNEPGEQGIALDEVFSYEVNVVENIMYLTFTNERHGMSKFEINLANNIDAFGQVDELDHPDGYAGDAHFFKAGAYDQCSTKDDPGFWYPACLGTGDWATDKANGDYVQVTFMKLVQGPAKK